MNAGQPYRERPRLWAPDAAAVALRTGARDVACIRDGERWTAPDELAEGDRYSFDVDGTTVPDPRSRSQPDGVHGTSEVVRSPRRVVAPVPVELDRAVIYELHVGTFSRPGTFTGAIDHLDHLVEVGVTHVELMPVVAFDGAVGWGYDGVDLFAPHPAYGTATDMAALVDACHERGLAVLLDVVHNHLGPSGNYLSATGPFFTDRYTTPWGDAVNLDGPGSDGVRSLLIDSALYWLDEVGVDGLRLDAVHALFDTSATPYLEQLADAVRHLGRATGRRFVLIAESDRNDPRILAGPPTGPGLDGVWCDDLHHCLHVVLTGEGQGYYEDYGAELLADALTGGVVYQGRWSPHRRRTVGRSFDGVDPAALVVSLQNHDQVGNRAAGERLHHLVGADRAAAAAALTLLSPFSVLLFQGEEWAASSPFPYFSDHHGDLGDAVRAGRRREFAAFGWPPEAVADPQDPATAEMARLHWDEIDRPGHREVLDWYRQLVRLRRDRPGRAGAIATVADGVVSARWGDTAVTANLSASARTAARPAGDVLAERGEVRGTSRDAELAPGAVIVTAT